MQGKWMWEGGGVVQGQVSVWEGDVGGGRGEEGEIGGKGACECWGEGKQGQMAKSRSGTQDI